MTCTCLAPSVKGLSIREKGTIADILRSTNQPPPQNRLISDVIKSRHPATVGELASILKEMGQFDETTYEATIKSMIMARSLRVGQPSYGIYTVLDYLLAPTVSGWFWLVLSLGVTATLCVYVVPNVFPLGILRWLFGLILICLPGYATIKLLFPFSELQFYERLALSVALSLAVIPIVGFILNFTPWGIRFLPIVTSLAAYAILTSTAAASRSYLALAQQSDQAEGE